MDARALLEQLLASGTDLVQQGQHKAEEVLGVPEAGEQRDAMLSGIGKGALAAGVLGLLLGTKSGRRVGGAAVKLGSLAAIGGLAYKAFQDWQAKQNTEVPTDVQPVNQLTGPAADKRSRILLKAMLGAAKADGHIDEAELAMIKEKVAGLGIDQNVAQFIQNEIATPVDVAALANEVEDVESAAEVYLASRMVIDVDNEAERQYLDALAKALKLPNALVQQLESAVSQA